MLLFTMILALVAGIWDLCLALNLEKTQGKSMFLASNLETPKENKCFCFPRASGDPGGTIGPATPKNHIYIYIKPGRKTPL